MKKTILFVFLAIVAIVATAKNNQLWEINFGWQSGWDAGPSLTIKSNGAISFIKYDPAHDTDRKTCVAKLEKNTLKKIKKKIDTIPDSISYGTKVTYLDNCFDEKENYIAVTIDGKVRVFVFSQSEKCWRVNVPPWLVELNTELNQYQDKISNCQASTSK